MLDEDIHDNIKKALASQDALSYFRYCEEGGVEPTDLALYQQGFVDHKREEKAESRLEWMAEHENVIEFLDEARELQPQDPSARQKEKIELLTRYFPQFRKGRKQDISQDTGYSNGVRFRSVVKSYNNRVARLTIEQEHF